MDLPQGSNNPDKERSAFARSFQRAVKRSHVFGTLERAWDRAALPVGGVVGTFLTASWFGLWQNVPPSARAAGVILFAAALAAAIRPLFKVKAIDREEALERMNKANGPGRLASTYDDIPTEGISDQSKAIYEFQRKQIERKVGKFKAGMPRSHLAQRDPLALRFALVFAAGLSFAVAASQNEVDDRLLMAADWTTDMRANLAKIDAWVTPPAYTGTAPVYIASTENRSVADPGSGYKVAEGSVLTVRLHDTHARVAISGGTTSSANSCKPSGKITECQFVLSGDANVTVRSPRTGAVSWQFNVTPDLPPRISVAPAPQTEDGKPVPGVTYTIEDEYVGSEVTGGRVRIPAPRDPEARPLPLFGQPALPVPVK